MSADLTKLSALAHLPVAPGEQAATLAVLETFQSAAARLPDRKLAGAEKDPAAKMPSETERAPGEATFYTQSAAPCEHARADAEAFSRIFRGGETGPAAVTPTGAETGPAAAHFAVAETCLSSAGAETDPAFPSPDSAEAGTPVPSSEADASPAAASLTGAEGSQSTPFAGAESASIAPFSGAEVAPALALPAARPAAMTLESLRTDTPVPSFSRETLLANAPAVQGGYILVPPVWDAPTEGDPA